MRERRARVLRTLVYHREGVSSTCDSIMCSIDAARHCPRQALLTLGKRN